MRSPAEDTWELVTAVTSGGLQRATALAFVNDPDPDFFISAKPTIAQPADVVNVAASPSFVSRLGSAGAKIVGELQAPDGSRSPLSIVQNETGAWYAKAGPFSLKCDGIRAVLLDTPSLRPLIGPPYRRTRGEFLDTTGKKMVEILHVLSNIVSRAKLRYS